MRFEEAVTLAMCINETLDWHAQAGKEHDEPEDAYKVFAYRRSKVPGWYLLSSREEWFDVAANDYLGGDSSTDVAGETPS